jgi:hypothetical protein
MDILKRVGLQVSNSERYVQKEVVLQQVQFKKKALMIF